MTERDEYTPSLDEVAGRAARDFADQLHFSRGAGNDAEAYEADYQRYKAGVLRMIEAVRQEEQRRHEDCDYHEGLEEGIKIGRAEAWERAAQIAGSRARRERR